MSAFSADMRQYIPSPFTVDSLYGNEHLYGSPDDAANNLSRKLSDVADRWIHIGVLLGVEWPWLKQRIGRDDDRQNLRVMLRHWLDSLDGVKLQTVVEAVRHSAGGSNPKLAERIKNSF